MLRPAWAFGFDNSSRTPALAEWRGVGFAEDVGVVEGGAGAGAGAEVEVEAGAEVGGAHPLCHWPVCY